MPSDDHHPEPETSSDESVAAPRLCAEDRSNRRARHRAPGPPLEHLAGLWGISPARRIDVHPGFEPVPLARVPVPGPGPDGDPDGVFAGLTPPLAALLLLSYTRPGDVVLDATSDLAVEGTARAGGRDYRPLDLADAPSCDIDEGAHLILLPWPVEQTPASPSPAPEQVGDLVECHAWLHSTGHVLVVAAEIVDADPSIPATRIAAAATASGLGRLRHLVEIVRPLDGAALAGRRTPSGLVAVVSASAGGRHA